MKGVALVIIGVALGFAVAHRASRSPQGKRFFDDVDSKARGFGGAVVGGYRSREAELRAATEDLVSDPRGRAH